jgi:hypothetical protein
MSSNPPKRSKRANRAANSTKSKVKVVTVTRPAQARAASVPPPSRRRRRRNPGGGQVGTVTMTAAPVNKGWTMKNPGSMSFTAYRHKKHGDGIVVRGRCFLTDLQDMTAVIPPQYGTFSTTSTSGAAIYNGSYCLLNPNVLNNNVEVLAECFELFQFTKVGTEILSAAPTSTAGAAVYGYCDDPVIANQTFYAGSGNDTRIGQTPSSFSMSLWQSSGVHWWPVLPDAEKWYFVFPPTTQLLMSNADWRQVFQGALLGAITNTSTLSAGILYGKMYLHYELRLARLIPKSAGSVLNRGFHSYVRHQFDSMADMGDRVPGTPATFLDVVEQLPTSASAASARPPSRKRG